MELKWNAYTASTSKSIRNIFILCTTNGWWGLYVVFYIGGTPKQLSALPQGISLIGAYSSQKEIYTVGNALEKGLGKTE